MKILIIGIGIPAKRNPQFGCFAMDQAKALKEQGHDVAYLFMNGYIGKIWKRIGFHKFIQDNIKCYESYGVPTEILKRVVPPMGYKIEEWWTQRIFQKVISDFGFPDIVHAHYINAIIQGKAIKKKNTIVLIGTEHYSKIADNTLPKRLRLRAKNSYKVLDQLITVSPYLKNLISSTYGVNSIVLGNVLSSAFTETNLIDYNNQKSIYTYVSCGSLIPRKGYETIIQAASKLSIPKDKWKIEIIGDGPQRKDLQDLIDNLNLQNNIILRGRLDRPSIADALRHSDSFILASKSETFGVVIIEALAMGLPCICTKCGGADNLITYKNGVYIDINDSNQLAKAMEYMYEKSNTYNAHDIREDCLNTYSPSAIGAQLTQIYNQVRTSQKR